MAKKFSLVASLMILSAVAAVAQTTPTDIVTTVEGNIDKVGTLGGKAYLIAAGLALAGVAIAFVKKAKR